MKALSIKQPWAWAILEAGKDIENRDWFTRFRGRVAIHASKGMTADEHKEGAMFIRRVSNIWPPSHPTLGAILGTVEIVDCVSESSSPWFVGDYGFVLRNPIVLATPIPCRGALSFWDVPVEIQGQIQLQEQGKL